MKIDFSDGTEVSIQIRSVDYDQVNQTNKAMHMSLIAIKL